MNLFTDRDVSKLGTFFSATTHGYMLVRPAGFLESEKLFLAESFLGGSKQGLIKLIADDKGSVGVEQIRQLLAGINLKSKVSSGAKGDGSERRLVLIDDSTKLRPRAQNILLKSLEEPVPGVYFIILCTNADDYLATIRSRSSVIKLDNPEDNSVKKIINSDPGLDLDEQSSLLVWLQSGRDLSNLEPLLNDQKLRDQKMAILQDAKKFFGSNEYEKYKIVNSYSKNKASALDLLSALTTTLEMITTSTFDMLSNKQLDNNGDVKLLSKIESLQQMYKNIDQSRQKINKNCNVRLAMTILV